MTKPVVVIAEELSPATIEALGGGFEVKNVDGTDRPALKAVLETADAILIRSATKIDAEAIGWANNLKVVARAGVGLDNVDVSAATAAGVMVVNAPTSNITSAAELTVAHILGLARHLQEAHASLSAGDWKRSSFTGIELFEKTIGIIGLGRIGALVAERLRGFGVKIVAYDPYITATRAGQLGAELISLEELVERSDFITIHMPKTPETVGMIGADQLKAMKKTAYVVNVARGGLIDENALAEAIKNGEIAGAALDVFVNEPPKDNSLTGLAGIHVTPHLGASTEEAQEKAGIAVAKSVRLALAGELVPDAVNVAGGVIAEDVRPGLPLTEKLGQAFAGLVSGRLTALDILVQGEIAEKDVNVLELAALKGFFSKVVNDPVSYVNAPLLAEQRGIDVRLIKESSVEGYRNVITLSGVMEGGRTVSVSGTLTGPKQVQKIVGINGYELELPLTDNLIAFEYSDRPGVVAAYGQILGSAGVNIAGLQVSRDEKRSTALSVLAVDSEIDDEIAKKMQAAVETDRIHVINLTDE